MTPPSRWRTFQTDVLSGLFAGLLRLWSASWRKDVAEIDRIDALLAANKRLLMVFWHGKYLPMFALFEGRQAVAFSAQSFRGEVIEKICHRFGYASVQIPEHAPGKAYGFVKRVLQSHNAGGLALDGPLGPYHVVKPGAIKLASDLGFLLVPVSVASAPKLVMSGRWDKREIPNFFAKVSVAVGDPIPVPHELKSDDLAAWEAMLQDMLEETDRKAEERLKTRF